MTNEPILLFEEDFADLPVGVIAGDYTPAGEYHVVPTMAETGRWRETVVHHSYKRISLGNWQVVLETDGKKVLEQTIQPEKWQPMLVAGYPYDWREFDVEAKLKPLTEEGWRCIAFRYKHARRFYGVAFANGKVYGFRRDNDDDTILAEGPHTLSMDQYTAVRVACVGPEIRVSIDGAEKLVCRDDSAGAYLEGGVGFAADDLVRFRDLRVTCKPEVAKAAETLRVQREEALNKLKATYPRAVLWKKIHTGEWGSDRNLRAADINGDGRTELVLARRTNRLGGDNYPSITSLAAFDLDGKKLWTYGEPGTVHLHTTSDLCYQLHDADGDGKAEVWFCRDHQLCLADGATGKIVRTMELPKPIKTGGWPRDLYRIFGDCLFFCDLAGSGSPDSFILKDRYKNAYAYGPDWKPLWQFHGNLGHFPYAADIDGDGKDELAFGYHLLDHDGTEQWSVHYKEHADNIAFVELQGQTRIVIAGSDAGFYILDLKGEVLCHYPLGHAQSMCVGNLLPERDGLEITCNTYWGPAGITATFDESGKLLHEFEPMPYACLLQPVNWVPADAGAMTADLMLLSTHPQQGGLIDGAGRRLVTFPDDGHPYLCSDARDLDGDGVDEILTWDEDAIWIYKAEGLTGRGPENYPRRNPWYNDSNYRAQISLPM